MLRRIIAPGLAIAGLALGTGAGLALKPTDGKGDADVRDGAATTAAVEHEPAGKEPTADYVKLANQFVVPLISEGRISSLVVLSLSLEAPPGSSDAIYAREPKLRDAFLRVLFDHANTGGFQGTFTEEQSLRPLRTALRDTARQIMGEMVSDVLIGDIMRQDI